MPQSNRDQIGQAIPHVNRDPLSVLADLLTERQDRDALPKPEPDVFDGDLLKYPMWSKSFQNLIERRTKEPSELLYYLGRYTSGAARDAISGLLFLDTNEAYLKAKSIIRKRYGDPYKIAERYQNKLFEWKNIMNNDSSELQKFSDFLQSCCIAMETTPYLSLLNQPSEIKKILSKLPNHIINRWGRFVDNSARRDEDDFQGQCQWFDAVFNSYPPFSAFATFIEKEARIACNPVTNVFTSTIKDQRKVFPHRNERRTLSTNSSTTESNRNETKKTNCLKCNKNHELNDCEDFMKLPLIERLNFTRNKSLCRGCLKYGHTKQDCRRKKVCNHCQRFHPTALHDTDYKPYSTKEKTDSQHFVSNCINSDNDNDQNISNNCRFHSMIVPVYIRHKDSPMYRTSTYALIDEQSDVGFITEELLQDLNIDGSPTNLQLSTMLGTANIESKKVTGLVVKGIYQNEELALPTTFSRDKIPVHRSQIPNRRSTDRWPHLQKISKELMPFDPDMKIGLLIGINCIKAVKPVEVIPGGDNDPYGIKTALGWSIVGNIGGEDRRDESTKSALYCRKDIDDKICHVSFRTHVKEVINPKQIKQMFELDFNESPKDEYLSHDDTRFMVKMQQGIHQLKNGHFEIPLPFREDDIRLPDNSAVVYKRTKGLTKRFRNDPQYRTDYEKFMNDLIKNDYAELVPDEELNAYGRSWYIPHHGVYHPKKPSKIRVVFDCSHTYMGESLNNHLLQGPDLTNNLVGVLCRFRQEKVAFICDIEAMFYQLRVNEEHRDFLRFYWWPDNNFENEPKTYRMKVHLFGAASSPGCANYGLKAVADLYEERLGKDVADFIKKNFYVDDGLKSLPTIPETIDLIERSKDMCRLGGFRLHKFLTNNKEVLQSIPKEDRSKEVMELDIDHDQLPIERTLGVQWCIESDTFQFKITLQDKPLTRRGILATVSSLFDPLGLVSPVILNGKRILQELCINNEDWDAEISDIIRSRWERWRIELHNLANLKIDRSFKPETFGEVKRAELHHFSDASLTGYGQTSYIRLMDTDDTVHTSLVMAKSRVSPSKPITIPRLELSAAVVSVKVAGMVKKELDYQIDKEYYWTDSKVVLGYVSNDSKRFHMYVSNRVQQIRNLSSPSQWNYIKGIENPADMASRGATATELTSSNLWWKGPDFLNENIEDAIDKNGEYRVIRSDDPEVRKVVTFLTEAVNNESILKHFERFSDWLQLRRAVAVCLRIQHGVRQADSTQNLFKNGIFRPSTVEELHNAELEIIKKVQEENFIEEINVLKSLEAKAQDRNKAKERKEILKKSSSLYKLDPFIDSHGIIRIGGRLKNSPLSYDFKFPIALPKKSHLTDMIIRHFHLKNKHQGRGITHNAIRASGYWIIGGRSTTSNVIAKCVTCKKLYRPTEEQKMSSLPTDRLQSDAPFTYAAVDNFGPFYVKDGRRELKRYGVLFICMASRAIHLEIANSMTTDSFINAYRRFVCRRGPVRQLRSDRGSNFIGAEGELNNAFKEMDYERIAATVLKDNCDFINFKFNVPEASHMGGSWERLIRSVRTVLVALLNEHGKTVLDDESLRTFFTEAECIVNSRPLSVENMDDPNYPVPLTPNHILTMKGGILLPPPGEFVREDLYLRKRWRRVQFLVNQFWKRWSEDYLQGLQRRQKWIKPKQNLEKGDIVLVKDVNVPRNEWKIARVCETFNSDDDLVRKVRVKLANSTLDNQGKRLTETKTLDRPIHKLILILRKEN